MATSGVNLAGLAAVVIAVLVALRESPNLLGSLVGLALLVAVFACGQGVARTALQSLAFGFACGFAVLGTLTYPLTLVAPSLVSSAYFQPLLCLVATAAFFLVDRSGANTSPGVVSLSGYAPSAPMASYAPHPVQPVLQPVAQPVVQRQFTPPPIPAAAPARMATVPEPVPESVPAFAAAAPAMSPAPAPLPALTGKEVSIYVNMMGEGMNVLRSVRAEHLGRDFYIIVEDMPADENWEYSTGQVVRCKKKSLSNGKGLVAYEEAPRAQ